MEAENGVAAENDKHVIIIETVHVEESDAVARPSLTQNLSFPAEGLRPDAMRKSIDVSSVTFARKIGSKNEVNVKSEIAKRSVVTKLPITLASSVPSLQTSTVKVSSSKSICISRFSFDVFLVLKLIWKVSLSANETLTDATNEAPHACFSCMLSPTRELAIQIAEQFEALGSGIGVKCAVLVGGI